MWGGREAMRIPWRKWAGIIGLVGVIGGAACSDGEPIAPGGVDAELVFDRTRLDMTPWAIAVGTEAAFAISSEAPNGRVVRIPLDGSAPAVIAAGLDLPGAIAVDGDEVFVATATQVMRLTGDGSAAPVALVTVDATVGPGLVVDATHVFYTVSGSPGAVRRVARAGGMAESISEEEAYPATLVLRGGRVYWNAFGDNRVRSANLDGTDVRTVAAEQNAPGLGLAVSDDGVFWFTEGDFPPKVMKAPIAGGAPVMLGTATTLEVGYNSSLVLHGEHVYVRTPILEDGTCGLARLPIAGGTAEPVSFDPALGCPLFITRSGSDLYFTFPGGVTRLELP
jgi:hypothetical protein